ncbi:hypothetical protein I204_08015 [Kwoniella mangroviensis CBS 8886]|nr:hypothetical protein I204_08015 [Kwoniella mangroviensis CBS 8886]
MSKPKPGLGKGLVRNLTVSQYHHSPSGIITLAPVIGQHSHSYSTYSSSNHTGSGPITSSKNGWPNNPSSSSISLLPTWDQPNDIVTPYQSSSSSSNRMRLKTTNTNQYTHQSRRYSSLSISPSAFLTSPIPPSLFFDKSLSFQSPPSSTSPAQISLEALLTSLESSSSFTSDPNYGPGNTFDNLPPDPPSSASTSRGNSPNQPLKTLRSVESHTVLSPSPLTISSDSNDSSSSLSFSSNSLLGLNEHSSNTSYDYPLNNENEEDILPSTYSSTLIFHLGCSGLAKERLPIPSSSRRSRPPTPPRQRSYPLPPVDPPTVIKSIGVGEDAYFARSDGLCIADGVGGWSRSASSGEKKADPGRWSRLLTHFVEEEVNDWWVGKEYYLLPREKGNEKGNDKDRNQKSTQKQQGWARESWENNLGGSMKMSSSASISSAPSSTSSGSINGKVKSLKRERERRPIDPVEIMQRGFEKCLSCINDEGIHGSSTCLLALLHNSTLHIANLGDCCLLLIRKGEVVFRTQEMQHAFNFPLQVGTHSRDEPMKDAQRYDVSVKKGDVVILGSDGLMDNLFDEDILEIVLQYTLSSKHDQPPTTSTTSFPPFSPQQISEALCRRARSVSELVTATTPFMCKAIEEGIDFVGGKKDDISVLVGVIGDREEEGSEGNGELTLHL